MSSNGTSALAPSHLPSAAKVASRTSLSPEASCLAKGFTPSSSFVGTRGLYGPSRLFKSGGGVGNLSLCPRMLRSCCTCDLTLSFILRVGIRRRRARGGCSRRRPERLATVARESRVGDDGSTSPKTPKRRRAPTNTGGAKAAVGRTDITFRRRPAAAEKPRLESWR